MGLDIWIVDSSPLIALAKVGRQELLLATDREVWVAEAVAREVDVGPRDDPARVSLAQGWGIRKSAVSVPSALQEWRLDAGEEAVLALALSVPEALAVLDDGDGRRAAQALNIPFAGTFGVVLRAKQEGRISKVAPVLRDLQGAGLFLPPGSRFDVSVGFCG